MQLRFRIVGVICTPLWPMALLIAALGIAVTAYSFWMPPVSLTDLYRWTTIFDRVGFGSIFVGMALMLVVDWLTAPFVGVN